MRGAEAYVLHEYGWLMICAVGFATVVFSAAKESDSIPAAADASAASAKQEPHLELISTIKSLPSIWTLAHAKTLDQGEDRERLARENLQFRLLPPLLQTVVEQARGDYDNAHELEKKLTALVETRRELAQQSGYGNQLLALFVSRIVNAMCVESLVRSDIKPEYIKGIVKSNSVLRTSSLEILIVAIETESGVNFASWSGQKMTRGFLIGVLDENRSEDALASFDEDTVFRYLLRASPPDRKCAQAFFPNLDRYSSVGLFMILRDCLYFEDTASILVDTIRNEEDVPKSRSGLGEKRQQFKHRGQEEDAGVAHYRQESVYSGVAYDYGEVFDMMAQFVVDMGDTPLDDLLTQLSPTLLAPPSLEPLRR